MKKFYLNASTKLRSVAFFMVAMTAIGFGSMPAKADYTIYPVPQNIIYGTTPLQLTQNVNVIIEQGVDDYTKARLHEVLTEENGITFTFSNKAKAGVSNIWLGINGSKGKADKKAKTVDANREVFSVQDKYDSHILSVRNNGKGIADVIIVGEHTNAVFFALATLEQILEQSANNRDKSKKLQEITISDYADLQYRGIVEGYYGYPYSFEVKKDLMQFFKRYKMNTYLYGAKSDPYHSGYWRDAYPENITPVQEKNGWLSQQMISELSKLSMETKVNFIWAIHPNSGKAVNFHTVDSTAMAVSDVMSKFEKMHALGVRQFAVFLDDAGWDFRDVNNYRDFLTNLQGSLEKRFNHNAANPSDTVMPIHYVPHIYAINFANEEQLNTYFEPISQTPSNIVVYTTGSGVWSSLRNKDFVKMQELMKRPVALWWNYPCNDNKDGRIYTADMISTLHEMGLPTPDDAIPECLGMVSNPMQQGEIAKICLFGVADYAWNNHAFRAVENWRASFARIVGEQNASLYNYLAKYLRYEDSEDLGKLIEQYKVNYSDGKYECKALCDTLNAIKTAANRMLAIANAPRCKSDELLLNDLTPWLLKLSKMAEVATDLLALPFNTNASEKDTQIYKITQVFADFKDKREYQVAALEGMGENPPSELHAVEPSHKYLMPFLDWLYEQHK